MGGNIFMIDYKIIGKRIKELRKEKGYTQEVLAEIAELSVDHISHIETGNTKMSLNVLVKIANAFRVPTDKLLYDSLYQSKELLTDDIARVFSDTSSDEAYVMLQAASAIKQSMRVRKLSKNSD